MPDITRLPEPCDQCGLRFRRRFDAFTNGGGWRSLCARCSDQPEWGPPRAYLGPWPIRAPRLTVIEGGAG